MFQKSSGRWKLPALSSVTNDPHYEKIFLAAIIFTIVAEHHQGLGFETNAQVMRFKEIKEHKEEHEFSQRRFLLDRNKIVCYERKTDNRRRSNSNDNPEKIDGLSVKTVQSNKPQIKKRCKQNKRW